MGYIPSHADPADPETDFFSRGGGAEGLPLVGIFGVLLGCVPVPVPVPVPVSLAVALRLPFAVCRGALLIAVAPCTRVYVCTCVCTCVRIHFVSIKIHK